MLTIRLARHGRKKAAFFRIVLTESTKKPQGGYKEVLGRFNPISHTMQIDAAKVKGFVANGAQISERVAKLLFKETGDKLFQKFFTMRDRTAAVKNPAKFPDKTPAPAPVVEAAPAPVAETPAPAEEVAPVAEVESAPEAETTSEEA